MNQQEQARIQVLNGVLEFQLPIAQAAEIMGVSERHTKRLLAAYRKHGAAALAHGNRGRKPHNAVPETAAAAVMKLASNGYAGANHSHFTELLREREGIDLSRPTVRRVLVRAGLGSPRSRRSQQHRFRRRRMPQQGMLVQIDGSQHPWLEDRGPKLTLLIAVDDATGTVAQAVFRTTEDTRGYLVLLEGLFRQWGIPPALYEGLPVLTSIILTEVQLSCDEVRLAGQRRGNAQQHEGVPGFGAYLVALELQAPEVVVHSPLHLVKVTVYLLPSIVVVMGFEPRRQPSAISAARSGSRVSLRAGGEPYEQDKQPFPGYLCSYSRSS